eukprot:TRINITY_DN6515_c0_g1_i2.p2 TRINITY_DN6515_c0_g1~~TRINITY_DN6515_c0_g1_i2.p2  ORF type:complete len:185 (-),score=35.39 TRINITY_DN6515_c0_g1_i2:127-651(-)
MCIRDSYKGETLTKNFIFLFIDALSRQNFLRKNPKTTQFLESLYWRSKTSKTRTKAYQFFRYHAHSHYTEKNMIPMEFGKEWFTDQPESNKHFNHQMKEAGFVSAFVRDDCSSRDFEIFQTDEFLNYLEFEKYDHENWSHFCDPAFARLDGRYSNFQGQNSIFRRCFYGKDVNA